MFVVLITVALPTLTLSIWNVLKTKTGGGRTFWDVLEMEVGGRKSITKNSFMFWLDVLVMVTW